MRSNTSGIIFNDEMDDFSIPGRDGDGRFKATESNYIQPGKRPLSSTTPTVLVAEDSSVKMVVGASGGSRITTAVTQVHGKLGIKNKFRIIASLNHKRPLYLGAYSYGAPHPLNPHSLLSLLSPAETCKVFSYSFHISGGFGCSRL